MDEEELTRAIIHAIQTIDLGPGAMVSEQEYRMASALLEAARWRSDYESSVSERENRWTRALVAAQNEARR